MKKHYIKKAIPKFMEKHSVWFVDETNWYVGITNDPVVRKRGHGSPNIFKSWLADSVEAAREIEKHFLSKGLKGDVGGGTIPKHVYIFKHRGPKA